MKQHTSEMRKRRKKLILQLTAVGLVCLLLMRFDFWIWIADRSGVQSDTQGKLHNAGERDKIRHVVETQLRGDTRHTNNKDANNNLLREMMEGMFGKKEADVTKCEIPYFKNIPVEKDVKPADCQRKKPVLSSCRLARELYGDPSRKHLLNICASQTVQEFCKLQQTKPRDYQVTCDTSMCDDGIHLGTVDINTAEEMWKEVSNKKILEESILNVMGSEHVGYCLIRCGRVDNRGNFKHLPMSMISENYIDPLEPVSQILILPPFVKASEHAVKDELFNFNFVFVDSVSRAHFFRSLPKSVKAIEKVALTMKSNSDSPVVLDYHLVQAVRSRTYESLQTLFSGLINPFEKPFGVQAMPRSRLNVKDLLAPLKDMGYVTQWVEDLCPFWEWGIAKDFLIFNKSLSLSEMWSKLKTTLKEVKLDSIGPTLSSCRILHANGHSDPFHGPKTICYDGKQQHEYIFDYLYMFHQEMLKVNQPYFSFYETNIAHESSGLRVQLFDHAFSKYLEYTASLENTLTVVFSDHGNAYGDFVTKSPEGKTEMYNPFLFLIMPKKLQTFIGNQYMKTLASNQHKLISLLDLHYTLTYLIEQLYQKSSQKHGEMHDIEGARSKVSEFNKQFNVTNRGLLSPISESRTCSHIPRIMPNLCICAGYDSRSNNYEYNFILAMYVVGQFNNNIQTQRRKHLAGTRRKFGGGFGRCYKMVADKIVNIQRSTDGDLDTVKMDLYVKTPGQQGAEIFFVAVSMTTLDDAEFHLENMDRITQYSKYSVCADPGVDLSLCICDLDITNRNDTGIDSVKAPVVNSEHYDKMKLSSEDIEVAGVKCFKVIQRSGLYGAVVEGFNGCVTSVKIYLAIATDNLIISPLKGMVLYPGDTTFLVAAVAKDTDKPWDWDIEVNILQSPE